MLLVLVAGCSSQWYQRDADQQVQRILAEAKRKTLGYEPASEIVAEPPPAPSSRSYLSIPFTPLPTEKPSPLEPVRTELTYGRLGPEMLWMDGSPPMSELTTEAIQGTLDEVKDRARLGPTFVDDGVVRMTLLDALRYAVSSSRTYQSRLEDLYLAALQVTLERHLLSPRPFARGGLTYNGGQADVNHRAALTATATAGVRQKLPLGGEVVASALVRFVDALTESAQSAESAQITLSASVPLLRGAGMINLEPLIQTEREMVYAIRSFEEFRRNFAVDIAAAYFALQVRLQAIDNQRLNYQRAVKLTERNLELYAAGRTTFLAVQQALTRQLNAERSLINAKDSYQTSLDRFKIQIGMPVEESLEIIPVELEIGEVEIAASRAVEAALRYRLDLRTAEDRVDDAVRAVDNARNGLLPDLNFNASGTIGNRPDTPARAIDDDSATYSAGIELDLPIDRLQERNRYRSSMISLERARRAFITTRDQIISDVRLSARSVRQAQINLDVARRAIRVARDQLEYSNELLLQGRASTRDVTDAQAALLDAQTNFDSARADLYTQVLRFLRDTGELRLDQSDNSLARAMQGESSTPGPVRSPREQVVEPSPAPGGS